MAGAGEDWTEVNNAEPGGYQRRKAKHWRPKNSQLSSRLQGRLTYEPPRLSDLQQQNRVKARKYFPKKKPHSTHEQDHPHAPRNTSSFIMRAKQSGGIAPPTPTPSTPAVLATPELSGYREGITEEVNKEWGVNGYGSMNGLIRLRAQEEGRNDSDSESDVDQGVESVQQLEQRLDQDLNRFEMVYPAEAGKSGLMLTGTQLEDQESHIAHLEEENLTLKERIFILEQQLEELREALRQHQQQGGGEGVDEMEICSGKSGGEGEGEGGASSDGQ